MKIGLTGKRNGPHPTLDSVGCPGGWNNDGPARAWRSSGGAPRSAVAGKSSASQPAAQQVGDDIAIAEARRPAATVSSTPDGAVYLCAPSLDARMLLGHLRCPWGSVPASLLKARGTAGPCSESLPARRISDFLRFSPSISAWYSTAFCCRCPHALAQVVSLSGRYL